MQTLFGSDAGKLALKEEQENMLDMLSLRFDESQSYNVGDYCLYFNGVYDGLYQFRNQKAPSPWMESTVIPVKLSDILKQHETALTNLSGKTIPCLYFSDISTTSVKDCIEKHFLEIPYGKASHSDTFIILCHFDSGTGICLMYKGDATYAGCITIDRKIQRCSYGFKSTVWTWKDF